MSWFGKKIKDNSQAAAEAARLERVVTISVEKHDHTTDKTVEKAQEVANKFSKIIEENGFTMIIKVAATNGRK